MQFQNLVTDFLAIFTLEVIVWTILKCVILHFKSIKFQACLCRTSIFICSIGMKIYCGANISYGLNKFLWITTIFFGLVKFLLHIGNKISDFCFENSYISLISYLFYCLSLFFFRKSFFPISHIFRIANLLLQCLYGFFTVFLVLIKFSFKGCSFFFKSHFFVISTFFSDFLSLCFRHCRKTVNFRCESIHYMVNSILHIL